MVDGFSFPAITRQIAAIYAAWKRANPRRNPRLRHLQRWWTSTSAIATARRTGATAPSGPGSAKSCLLRSRSPPRPCRARRHDRHSSPEGCRRRPRLQQACTGGRAGTAHRRRLRWWRCGWGALPDGWTTPPGLSLCAGWDPRRSPRPGRCLTSCRWRSISIPGEPSFAGAAPGEPAEKCAAISATTPSRSCATAESGGR